MYLRYFKNSKVWKRYGTRCEKGIEKGMAKGVKKDVTNKGEGFTHL